MKKTMRNTKKTMTLWIAGILALAILVAPAVFNFSDYAFAQSQNTTEQATALQTQNPDYAASMQYRKGRGGGKGGARGRKNTDATLSLLSDWSGISKDTLQNIMDSYSFNAAKLTNTVVLSKAANISLDDAASIVAEGNLMDYIDENGLTDAFISVRQDLAAFRQENATSYRQGSYAGDGGYGKGAGASQGRIWQDFADSLASWAGVSVSDITAIQEEYGFNAPRTVNTVILAKVQNISLDDAASIVAEGNLRDYVEENGLTDAFQAARQEFMSILRGN